MASEDLFPLQDESEEIATGTLKQSEGENISIDVGENQTNHDQVPSPKENSGVDIEDRDRVSRIEYKTDDEDEIEITEALKAEEEDSEKCVISVPEGIHGKSVISVPKVKLQEPKLIQLPLSRVRALMKLDPDLHIASNEAVFSVTKATEMFIESLAKESFTFTAQAKKKTVQKRDVDLAIASVDSLMFLEGSMNF